MHAGIHLAKVVSRMLVDAILWIFAPIIPYELVLFHKLHDKLQLSKAQLRCAKPNCSHEKQRTGCVGGLPSATGPPPPPLVGRRLFGAAIRRARPWNGFNLTAILGTAGSRAENLSLS